MNTYKERMAEEYHQLKDRTEKLNAMLDKYEKGILDFTPTCPISLLYEQLGVMRHYICILEERANIEEITL